MVDRVLHNGSARILRQATITSLLTGRTPCRHVAPLPGHAPHPASPPQVPRSVRPAPASHLLLQLATTSAHRRRKLAVGTAALLRNLTDGLRAEFGHCRRSGVAIREAASGCTPVIRTSTTANVGSHFQRMRTYDPNATFISPRLGRPFPEYNGPSLTDSSVVDQAGAAVRMRGNCDFRPRLRRAQPTLIARTSAARSSTGIIGGSPFRLTGRLRR